MKIEHEYKGYPVDPHGRVYTKRKHGKPLKIHVSDRGYPYVQLWIAGKNHPTILHRIVAHVFLGPCPEGYEVDHIDNNKLNFHPSNLQYVTRSENMLKRMSLGTEHVSGFNAGPSKYTEEQFTRALELLSTGLGVCEVARLTNVKRGTVGKLNNRTHFYCKQGKL